MARGPLAIALPPPHTVDVEAFTTPPVRATLINRDVDAADAESGLPAAMEFFLNPDGLDLTARAEWARIAVPGLSHEVLQYSHSTSDEVSFDLEWSAQEAGRRRQRGLEQPTRATSRDTVRLSQRDVDLMFLYRDFLKALTVPLERGRAPSRVVLVWPNFLHLTGAVTSVDFKFTRFSRTGAPMAFTAGIEMVELRTVFRKRRGRISFFDDRDEEALEAQDRALNFTGTFAPGGG